MGPGLFWGIILIIIGLSLVIKIVFNVEFPIFKIIIAFILIYLGVKILVGSKFSFFHSKSDSDVVFGESRFTEVENGKEYNVVFGKGAVDLRGFKLTDTTRIKVKTVFGNTEVFIPRDMPVYIHTDAVMASARMPNGNSSAFGSTVYKSDSLDMSKPYLDVEVDVVFGNVIFTRF